MGAQAEWITTVGHRTSINQFTSKTARLPTEPVKDGQPLSAKLKRSIYSNRTVSYSNRAVEKILTVKPENWI